VAATTLVLASASPARLATLVGPSRAALLPLAGARIEAPEALAWGLVDRIVEPEELDEAAAALCAPALAAGAGRVAAIRAMIRD